MPFGFDAIVPQLEEAIGVARKSWVVELNTELAARDAREHDLVALLKQAHTFHIVRACRVSPTSCMMHGRMHHVACRMAM